MNCDHTLSKVLKCAAILLIVAVTANANILKGPRNNLRLGALFSLKVQGVPRVQILFEGDILQTSLVPQKVTCMCRVQWETIITTEGSVEFRPPEDWVRCKEFEFDRDILVRVRDITDRHSFTLEIKEEEYFVQGNRGRVAVSPIWRMDLSPYMYPAELSMVLEDAYQLNTQNLPSWTLVSER